MITTLRPVPLVAWAAVILLGCSDAIAPAPEPPPVGSVVVTGTLTELVVGGTVQLQAALLNQSGVAMSGGHVVWSSSDQAVATVTAGGLVSAVGGGAATISATAGQASGHFAIRVLPPFCRAPESGSIAPGESRSGSIGPSDCRFSEVFDNPARGWRLELAAPARLDFRVSNAPFGATVVITDQRMNPMAWLWPSGRPMRAHLPAGSYVVWVVSADRQHGPFQLAIANSAPECTAASAATIVPPSTVTGTITGSDCILPNDAHGVGWRFDLGTATRLSFELSSSAFHPVVVVTDLSMNPIAGAYAHAPGEPARLVQSLSSGSYLVWAMAADDRLGAFQFSIAEAEPYSCPVPPGTIARGQTVNGTISTTSCLLETGTYANAHTLTLPTATTVRIDLVSGQFDTFLLLADEAGVWLAADDDGGDGLNSRIVISLGPGQYTIWATTYSRGAVGSYQLSVADLGSGAAIGTLREDGVAIDGLPGHAPGGIEKPPSWDWGRNE